MIKIFIFSLCLTPVAVLAYEAFTHTLGANPVQTVQFTTGDWTLRFLLITLCVSPAARLTGRSLWMKYRRMLGLFAFFYGCLHLLTWAVLDQSLDLKDMLKDVIKHKFITAGMASLALMIPLALTSTDAMVRRLGEYWGKLHRLVYISAAAGVIHYFWLVKKDHTKPLLYIAVLTLLLGYRASRRLTAR